MVLSDNLIAYYKCDESSGSLLDAHNSNDMSIGAGAPGTATGKINTARTFDGNDYFSAPGISDFFTNHSPTSSQRSWAANFWIYPFSLSTDRGVIATDGTSGSFGMLIRTEAASGGRVAFFNSTNGTTFDKAMAVGSVSVNTWHMVSVGWDKSAGEIWGFLDTTFAASVAMSAYHTSGGYVRVGSWVAASQYYDGRLDEFAWWRDRAQLTQEEVEALYNHGNGLPLENFDVPICWSYVAQYKKSYKRYRQSGPGPFPHYLKVPSNVDLSTGRMVDNGRLIDTDEYEIVQ